MINFQHRVLSIRKSMHRLIPALSTITSARLMSTQDVKWLWEANDYIQDFHRANLAGTRIGSFTVSLNCSKPLEEEDVRKSLNILMRKRPILRACLQTRGERLWFGLLSNLKLDFKVMKNGTTSREAFVSATERWFQVPNTAQWSVRLFPQSEEVECPIPGVKDSYPIQYGLVFSAVHGIMDGCGVSSIIKSFVDIMNDVIEGKPVDENEYLPFIEEKELPVLFDEMEEKLREDPSLMEAVKSRIPSPDHVPLFLQAFPPPEVNDITTKYVSGVLEPKIFNILGSRVKSEGVTLTSALLAIINVAVMELMKERGLLSDRYQIASLVIASMRRYMKPPSTFYFGPTTGHMTSVSNLDSIVRDHFWKYCQSVNKELHTLLHQGAPLQEQALKRLLSSGAQPYDYVTREKAPIHDYSINNIGNFSWLISEDKKYVTLTGMASYNMMHNAFSITYHEILSIGGKIYYTLSYDTGLVSDATASLLFERILAVLKEVSHLP